VLDHLERRNGFELAAAERARNHIAQIPVSCSASTTSSASAPRASAPSACRSASSIHALGRLYKVRLDRAAIDLGFAHRCHRPLPHPLIDLPPAALSP